MKKNAWIKTIKNACLEVGTYQPPFDSVIDTLADILERRDALQKAFTAAEMDGSSDAARAMRMLNTLNMDALAYWRDLGLTPAGLKKINEQGLKPKKKTTLGEVLSEIEGL